MRSQFEFNDKIRKRFDNKQENGRIDQNISSGEIESQNRLEIIYFFIMLSQRLFFFQFFPTVIVKAIVIQLKVINFFNLHSEHWWCTEYADEIHDVLRKRECDRFYFEYKAPQIKWRMHLLSFMLDLAEIQNLGAETFHLGEWWIGNIWLHGF